MRRSSYPSLYTNEYFNSTSHQQNIKCHWAEFSRAVQATGEKVFGKSCRKNYVRPGWNSYVKELYKDSRRAFLHWRSVNSPRRGALAVLMTEKRALLKLALSRCEHNEQTMRAEDLASKTSLWQCCIFLEWG